MTIICVSGQQEVQSMNVKIQKNGRNESESRMMMMKHATRLVCFLTFHIYNFVVSRQERISFWFTGSRKQTRDNWWRRIKRLKICVDFFSTLVFRKLHFYLICYMIWFVVVFVIKKPTFEKQTANHIFLQHVAWLSRFYDTTRAHLTINPTFLVVATHVKYDLLL